MNKIVNGVANDYEFPQMDYTHHDSRTDEPLQKQIQTFTRWVDPTIKDLQQELDQYKNNWEELEKWLKKAIEIYNDVDVKTLLMVQDKLKELEEE